MSLFMIFVVLISVLAIRFYRKNAKEMFEDYQFMRSELEARDFKQDIEDKVCTSMIGNGFVQSMVDISMLNHPNSEE
ncbi:MAG: hypothetical protein KIG94_01775 [Acetatifactor sp.]|nr:hypothetical protein [Acetatifactor sp.]